jgi:hypothetical protein
MPPPPKHRRKAYRQAYNTTGMTPATVNRGAHARTPSLWLSRWSPNSSAPIWLVMSVSSMVEWMQEI